MCVQIVSGGGIYSGTAKYLGAGFEYPNSATGIVCWVGTLNGNIHMVLEHDHCTEELSLPLGADLHAQLPCYKRKTDIKWTRRRQYLWEKRKTVRFMSCFGASSSKGFLIHPETLGLHVSFTLVLKSLQESGIKLSAVPQIHAGRGPPCIAVRKQDLKTWKVGKKIKAVYSLGTKHV